MMKYIEERSPFSAECPSVLQNVVTKEMMTEEIRKDVLNASEIGKKKYEAFHSDRIIKKNRNWMKLFTDWISQPWSQ